MAKTKPPKQGAIKDKAFSKRLNDACDLHPHVPPYNFGRLSWVREHMRDEHHVSVSMETVRKWFAGEARPRPDKMSKLASLLKVDEAWLSLGITPGMKPEERQAFHLASEGAVNLVAGMIQIAGGHPALPDDGDAHRAEVNLYAILSGKQYGMFVALGKPEDDKVKFTIPANFGKSLVLGVVPTGAMRFDVLQLESDKLEKHAAVKGGFAEVILRRYGSEYMTKRDRWQKIKDFSRRI